MPITNNVWDSFNETKTNSPSSIPAASRVSEGNNMATANTDPDLTTESDLDFSPTISIGNIISSTPKEMVILEPGEYTATINNITRSFHEASGKLPRCPQVTVEFAVILEDGSIATCKKPYYIINRDWANRQIYFLFKAAKLIEGGTFTPDWDALRDIDVHITVDNSLVNGRTYHNNVVRVDPFGEGDLPF